jgi:hypothetical protein
MQENHYIASKRWKLNSREEAKYTYDKEMLEIIHALEKWK